MSLYEASLLVQQDQKGRQGRQAPQELLYVLSRCVAVGVVRASAIVLVVKLRVRLLALQLQGAL
jgi:hypothetical protein